MGRIVAAYVVVHVLLLADSAAEHGRARLTSPSAQVY
jgi:hypothetical protein